MNEKQIILQLEGMYRLGLITKTELDMLNKAHRDGGLILLKSKINEYYKKQLLEIEEEDKKIAKELRTLIRDDKNLLNKWKRQAQKNIKHKISKQTNDYIKYEKLNQLKNKKLELQMAAADRKIDEIIDEATRKIELEITNKIREKLI